MKSGFVGIIGRPNVGKSTLINSIIGRKVAITSNKPQTTRNIIQGIYNEDKVQIVFVDTPGIHKPVNKLGKTLNRQAYYSIEDTDIILFLVDAFEGLGKGDIYILDKLKNIDKPVILVINKIDKIPREEILNRINDYKDLYDFAEIVPVSSITKSNIDDLVETLKKYLPDSVRYYGEDSITNKSIDFLMAEIVREKVLRLTKEEIPHAVTCYVEHYEETEKMVKIHVLIVVDRDNLKKILIGKNGSMLKEIGTQARYDMEEFLGKKVYIETYVKTLKNWRDEEKYFSELGLKEDE